MAHCVPSGELSSAASAAIAAAAVADYRPNEDAEIAASAAMAAAAADYRPSEDAETAASAAMVAAAADYRPGEDAETTVADSHLEESSGSDSESSRTSAVATEVDLLPAEQAAVDARTADMLNEDTASVSSPRYHDSDQPVDVGDIDSQLARKVCKTNLTATNVKVMIQEVVKNPAVLAMLKNSLERDADKLLPATYEPKMTRAKARQIRQQGNPAVPWPNSPAKNQDLSYLLSDIPSADEDDDVEYTPDQDSLDESDEEESTLDCSQVDEIAMSPALSEPRIVMTSTPTTSDVQSPPVLVMPSLDIPKHVPARHSLPPVVAAPQASSSSQYRQPAVAISKETERCFLNALDELDFEPPIAGRTRSKVPLNEERLECLEAQLVAPDVEPDAYAALSLDEDDDAEERDWLAFLGGILVSVEDRSTVEEEENDPEYNVLAAIEAAEEEEEDYRNDGRVKIPKAEIHNLMDELVEACEAEEERAESLPKSASVEPLSRQVPLPTPARAQPKRTVSVKDLIAMRQVESSPAVRPRATLEGPIVTFAQSLQIQAQMRKHVQLLLQMYVLTSGRAGLEKEHASSGKYLMELAFFRDHSKLKDSSHFSAHNLAQAVQIVEEGVNLKSHWQNEDGASDLVDLTEDGKAHFVMSASDAQESAEAMECSTQDDDGKPLPTCPSGKRPKKSALEELSPEEMEFFANCAVCIYPSLMPCCRLSAMQPRARLYFSPSEDSLICHGLDQFDNTGRKFDLIHEFLLPLHAPGTIKSRVKRVRNCRVDTTNSQLAAYLRDKVLPNQPLVLELFDAAIIKKPIEWDATTSGIPSWLVEWKKRQLDAIPCSDQQAAEVVPLTSRGSLPTDCCSLPAVPLPVLPAVPTGAGSGSPRITVDVLPSSSPCHAQRSASEAAVEPPLLQAPAASSSRRRDSERLAATLNLWPAGSCFGSDGVDGGIGSGDSAAECRRVAASAVDLVARDSSDSLKGDGDAAEAASGVNCSKSLRPLAGTSCGPVATTAVTIGISEPDGLTAAASDSCRTMENARCLPTVQPSDTAQVAAAEKSGKDSVASDVRTLRSARSDVDDRVAPNALSVATRTGCIGLATGTPTAPPGLLCSAAAASSEAVMDSTELPCSLDADWHLEDPSITPCSSTEVATHEAHVGAAMGGTVAGKVAILDSCHVTDTHGTTGSAAAAAASAEELVIVRSPLSIAAGPGGSATLGHLPLTTALPLLSPPAPSAENGDRTFPSSVILLATTPTRWPAAASAHSAGTASPKRGTRRLLAAATPPSSSSTASSQSGATAASVSATTATPSPRFSPLSVKKTMRSPRRRLLRSQARQLMPKSFSLGGSSGSGTGTGCGVASSCSPSKIVARSLTQRAVKTSVAGGAGGASRSRLLPVNPGRDETLAGLSGADQAGLLTRDRKKGGRGRARGSRAEPASAAAEAQGTPAQGASVPAAADDEDDDLAALLEASTTIRDSATGHTGAAPSRLKKRKLDRNLACLAPDIVASDPMRDEKETNTVKNFLSHCRAVLGGRENPTFTALLSILSGAADGESTVRQLYLAVRDVLIGPNSRCDTTHTAASGAAGEAGARVGLSSDRELPAATADPGARQRLMTEFAALLPPNYAFECGTQAYADSLEYDKGRQFLRKLEVYFGRSSASYQKLMRLISGWDESRQSPTEFKESVTALLKGHLHLLEEFRTFFPDEPVPKRFSADYEFLDLTACGSEDDDTDIGSSKPLSAAAAAAAAAVVPDGYEYMEMPDEEDTQATEKCRCQCHAKGPSLLHLQRLAHCRLCCVRIVGCTLYVHTPKGLRPASITYFDSEQDVAEPAGAEKTAEQGLSPQREFVEVPVAGESEEENEEVGHAEYDEDEDADSEVEQDDDEEEAEDNVPDYYDDDDGAASEDDAQSMLAGSPAAVGSPATPASCAASPIAVDGADLPHRRAVVRPATASDGRTLAGHSSATSDGGGVVVFMSAAALDQSAVNSNVPWTRDEDKLILETFQEEEDEDGNYDTSDAIFHRIAAQMQCRTSAEVRARFNFLLELIARDDES